MRIYKRERAFQGACGIAVYPHRVVDTPEHLHEFIEIVYVMDGVGNHTVDGVEYAVKRGTLLFINYRQVHSFFSEKGMEIWDILIDPEWLTEKLIDSENAFELLTLSAFSAFQQAVDTQMPLVQFHAAERSRLEHLLRELYEEQEKAAAGYETVQKAYANILLTLIFRKMSAGGEPMGLTPEFLQYTRNHCNEKLTLEELSESCFYNPSYFSRLFKEHYGMTLTEFIGRSRLELAERLLKETNLSAEEIAAQAGFSARNAFYKAFKEKHGMTPQQYRKKEGQN